MIVAPERALPPSHRPALAYRRAMKGREKKQNFLICAGLYTLGRASVVSHVWQLRTFHHKSVNFQQYHYHWWLESTAELTSNIYINRCMCVICVHTHTDIYMLAAHCKRS